MSIITKDTIMQHNIEQAIQRTFNIKSKRCTTRWSRGTLTETGIEIGGIAVASQNCHELTEHLRSEGHDYIYDFVPNGKWSCINFTKIKLHWARRAQQTASGAGGATYNIIPGVWSNGSFYPDLLSKDVEVEIKPTTTPTSSPSNYILLPVSVYRFHYDISNNGCVPALRFGRCELQCITPLSLFTVSINRQGIYINRKFREKADLITETVDYPKVDQYELTIRYKGHVVFKELLHNP